MKVKSSPHRKLSKDFFMSSNVNTKNTAEVKVRAYSPCLLLVRRHLRNSIKGAI